jgi:16S rRNA (adenine1518-N6/adenine1519-N6)-dimethyltransferase
MTNQHKALKKFGQNYLTDKNILRKIAEEVNPSDDDVLIEIGPGYGALTEFIVDKCKNLTAIEIDSRVIDDLQIRFPNLKVLNCDFLEFNIPAFFTENGKRIRVVGNIPYNLTSPILFNLIENQEYIQDAVFLVQDEVARRINAKRGTKEYGILAVILQHFSEVKYCFKVSPNVFNPKPKVNSAVIHVKFKEEQINDPNKKLFIKTVKSCFGNRRKTLKNSLSNSIFKDVDFSNCEIDLSLRAEQLEINDFITLTQFVSTQLK